MIYIEPTPYILGLIDHIKLRWSGKIDILFLNENVSQDWNITLQEETMILPLQQNRFRFVMQLMRKNKYHLIHLAGWGNPILLFVLFFAKILRIPVVVESDTAHRYDTKPYKKWIKKVIYPNLFKLVDVFFPGGLRQKKYLEQYKVKQSCLSPMNMTVDITGMRRYAATLTEEDRLHFRKQHHVTNDAIIFLFVGRLVSYKGIQDLVAAFTLIQNKNAVLFFVGGGEMHDYVTQISNGNPHIHYLGRLSGNALIQAYYAADVLALPSHFEPWGLVVNEAMALGLPVIVSDRVGCIDDLVMHRENGIIAKAEDITELKQAIEFLADHSNERLRMGKASREKIAAWTLENSADTVSDVWKKITCI